MLIRIDESVVKNISENIHSFNDESPEIKGLNNLAKAAREGWHIVIGSLEVLEFLKGLTLLERNSLRLFHGLYSKFAFLSSYEDFFCDYINVRGDDSKLRRHVFGGHNVFEVPINFFADTYTTLRTSLVSEDINDCEFYVKLARKYINETMRSHNIRINFDHENGGGQNTFKIYEAKVLSKKMVLAIADSDKSYPTDTIGDTLSELIKTHNKYKKDYISELLPLGVREKENLVPPSLYLLCTNNSTKEYLKKLQKLEISKEHGRKLMFLDVKDGIKAKKFKNDSILRDFINELFESHTDVLACTIEEIASQEDEFKIIEGVGSKLAEFLEEILDDGLEKKLQQKKSIPGIPEVVIKEIEGNIEIKKALFNNLPDFLKPEWERICNKIIAWGCSEHMVAI